MHSFPFLDELVLLSLVAVLVILVFQKLKLPPVIGLIVTGLMLGPAGFGLVAQDELISNAAEIGVVMLLFTVGLEFSFEELQKLKRIVLVAGPLQVILSTAVAALVAIFIHWSRGQSITTEAAILTGMCTALSSTAICIKLLKDRHELQSDYGRVVMGILIFQDIAVVPMMIIATMLVSSAGIQVGEIMSKLGVLVAVIAVLITGLRYLLPRLIPFVTRVSAPEVLILGGMTLCFGVAWITSSFGLSMALGAFIAGVAIAGTHEGHQIGSVIEPIRDVFTSMFFLSVGLLVNAQWSVIPFNMVIALLMIIVNASVLVIILRCIRVDPHTSIVSSMVLAQVGEFSFVLASLGKEYGILTDSLFQNLLVSIIITMIFTPFLVMYAPVIARRLASRIDASIG